MTNRDENKTRRARALTRRTGEAPAAPGANAAVVRTKPVRTTVDLSPAEYREVNARVLEVAAALGRKTSYSHVMRALVAQLSNPEVRAAVVAWLDEAQPDISQ